MGLTRAQVFDIIDAERDYQDVNYNPEYILTSGITRFIRDKDVTSHLVMLDTYLRDAQDAWTKMKNGDSTAALQQLAKIATIAVRALERAGGSELLLEIGLR